MCVCVCLSVCVFTISSDISQQIRANEVLKILSEVRECPLDTFISVWSYIKFTYCVSVCVCVCVCVCLYVHYLLRHQPTNQVKWGVETIFRGQGMSTWHFYFSLIIFCEDKLYSLIKLLIHFSTGPQTSQRGATLPSKKELLPITRSLFPNVREHQRTHRHIYSTFHKLLKG